MVVHKDEWALDISAPRSIDGMCIMVYDVVLKQLVQYYSSRHLDPALSSCTIANA